MKGILILFNIQWEVIRGLLLEQKRNDLISTSIMVKLEVYEGSLVAKLQASVVVQTLKT